MSTRRERLRSRFTLEALEGRVALSHAGAAVEDGPHHNRGGNPAEVHVLRHGDDDGAAHNANDDKGGVRDLRQGADDPADHDANDDKGGAAVGVHQHRGGRAATVQVRRHGADDPAGHR